MKKHLHIILLILLFSSLAFTYSCKEDIDYETIEIEQIEDFLSKHDLDITPKPSGLYFKDITVGIGEVAQALDTVEVYYTGFYLSGIKFDSNVTSDEPLRFVVWDSSYNSLIDGFYEAVTYMKASGEAFVIFPSWLAYGTSGSGSIPGYTPIIFELELVKIDRGPGTK